ncbi:hypothetical protein [Aldersonia kunmingensis]|uniref:hypothetical protein n=1 Tax=Aldersonia kunmingensis TaxID=408066 RepID=UPI000A773CB7|nr:hypothetical protein [Aldersonia kunmingensis]
MFKTRSWFDSTINNNTTNNVDTTINMVMQALVLDLGSSNLGSGSSLFGPS